MRSLTAICPVCKREVEVRRDLDGVGRETGPMRFTGHAGLRWGRFCKMGGELVSTEDLTSAPELSNRDLP